ncbi:MAG: iron-containing alcohol dehydrogenase, partial [candidate division NC10 bacterium]|nr:iron-containing alcohol dehydrogenase [candidate division NC10 bacterium]
LLGVRTSGMSEMEAAMALPGAIVALMRDVGLPNGLREVGYLEQDIPTMAAGAMKQQRLLACSPRPVALEDLEQLFRAAMQNW